MASNQENKQARRSAFFVLAINLAIMLAVGTGLVIGVQQWLNNATLHGESVNVPDLKGMTVADATRELGLRELQAVVADSGYNETLPPGVVLAQTPKEGNSVKPGREIFLTINSEHSPTMPLPDIADNCSRREAEAKLKALGFKRVVMQDVTGDEDWVISVKCDGREVAAGTRVPLDAVITVLVGDGTTEETEYVGDSIMPYEDVEIDTLL